MLTPIMATRWTLLKRAFVLWGFSVVFLFFYLPNAGSPALGHPRMGFGQYFGSILNAVLGETPACNCACVESRGPSSTPNTPNSTFRAAEENVAREQRRGGLLGRFGDLVARILLGRRRHEPNRKPTGPGYRTHASPHHGPICQTPFASLYDRRLIVSPQRTRGGVGAARNDSEWFSEGSQCSRAHQDPKAFVGKDEPFRFTPNREWYPNVSQYATAVALPLLGYPWAFLDQIALVLPQWHLHFLTSTRTLLLILIDSERGVSLEYVAAVLSLQRSSQPCDLQSLDLGYTLFEYHSDQKVSYVLVGNVSLPRPEWVVRMNKTNHDMAQERWQNPECNRREYFYIYGTTYFTYELLRLEISNYFDFFWKLDYDVFLQRTIPPLMDAVVSSQAHVVYYHKMFEFLTCLKQAIPKCVETYFNVEKDKCGTQFHAQGQGTFDWISYSFYGNFFLYWLGYFQSPEIMHWAQFWNTFPEGKWMYRWGDQEYFLTTLGLAAHGKSLQIHLEQFHVNDQEKEQSPALKSRMEIDKSRSKLCSNKTHFVNFFDEVILFPHTQSDSERVERVQDTSGSVKTKTVLYAKCLLERTFIDIMAHHQIGKIGFLDIREPSYNPKIPDITMRQVLVFGVCTGIYAKRLEWHLPPNYGRENFVSLFDQVMGLYQCEEETTNVLRCFRKLGG